MAVPKTFSNMTDQEFLLSIEGIMSYSPIIKELCERLERSFNKVQTLNSRVECPVCQAQLLIEPNEANDLYDIKIERL